MLRHAACQASAAARCHAAAAHRVWQQVGIFRGCSASAQASPAAAASSPPPPRPLSALLPGYGVRKPAKVARQHPRTADGSMLQVAVRERAWLGSRRAAQAKAVGYIPAVINMGDGSHRLLELTQRDAEELQRAAGYKAMTTRRLTLSVGPPGSSAGVTGDGKGGDGEAQAEAGDEHELVPVLIQKVDREPWSDRIRNLDMLYAPQGMVITKRVPLRLVGEEDSITLRRGGYIHIVERAVKLTCKVEDLPPYVTIDVSQCRIGQRFLLEDIVKRLPEGVRLATNALPEGTLRAGTVSVALCLGKRRAMAALKAELDESS